MIVRTMTSCGTPYTTGCRLSEAQRTQSGNLITRYSLPFFSPTPSRPHRLVTRWRKRFYRGSLLTLRPSRQRRVGRSVRSDNRRQNWRGSSKSSIRTMTRRWTAKSFVSSPTRTARDAWYLQLFLDFKGKPVGNAPRDTYRIVVRSAALLALDSPSR